MKLGEGNRVGEVNKIRGGRGDESVKFVGRRAGETSEIEVGDQDR